MESINAFNSFYPMEVIATAAETKKLVEKNNGKSFLVFPESRLYSIRMKNDLPQRWILQGIQNSFSDIALRGEFFTFQLGVYALQDLKDVTIHFTDLKNEKGNIIPAKNIGCINTEGIKYDGTVYTNKVDVLQGRCRPCGAVLMCRKLQCQVKDKFTVRVLHHDAKIGNILFDKQTGEILCAVDFDTLMPGYFFSDFGDLVRASACSAGGGRKRPFKSLYYPRIL